MTLIEKARARIHSPILKKLAKEELTAVPTLLNKISEGKIVVPKNRLKELTISKETPQKKKTPLKKLVDQAAKLIADACFLSEANEKIFDKHVVERVFLALLWYKSDERVSESLDNKKYALRRIFFWPIQSPRTPVG